MSGSSSHDSPSRKPQPPEDALDGASSSASALGRTLEAELTRAATRPNPASLSTPPDADAPADGAAKPAGPSDQSNRASGAAAPMPAAPGGAATRGDESLDLLDRFNRASGAAAAEQEAHADGDAEDAQAGAPRRPRIGWGGVLALLNVVLSGFILMLWGVPRWDGARVGAAGRVKDGGPGVRAGASRGDSGRGNESRASGDAAAASPLATVPGGEPGLNAASAAGGLTGRAPRPGASGGSDQGDAGNGSVNGADADGADAAGGADVPELPQAIISVMPGQRAPDVAIPPAPAQLPPSPPSAASDAGPAGAAAARDDAGAVTPGADAAIEAGSAAARATRGAPASQNAGSRVPVAGANGVTMPERLAESHVRPTIAALADGEPVTGEVTLAATIRIDGSVADVQVLSSSRPGAGLEHAAADAVRRWRYKPATRDGQPIDSRLTITVTFR